jgi:hypothetical protein
VNELSKTEGKNHKVRKTKDYNIEKQEEGWAG